MEEWKTTKSWTMWATIWHDLYVFAGLSGYQMCNRPRGQNSYSGAPGLQGACWETPLSFSRHRPGSIRGPGSVTAVKVAPGSSAVPWRPAALLWSLHHVPTQPRLERTPESSVKTRMRASGSEVCSRRSPLLSLPPQQTAFGFKKSF